MKLIESDVDVVILAEPPHFRPAHLKAAIAAGKHVFCEKPVAVDAAGVRSVLATAEEAKKKNLNIVSGLCWRYDWRTGDDEARAGRRVGEIISIQETYLAGSAFVSSAPAKLERNGIPVHNWQYFVWLSGDFNNEQHVHSLDKAAWAMREESPLRAWGIGGRQRRDQRKCDVYDHHAVTYEYDRGVHVHSYCRQIAGCHVGHQRRIFGTKGRASILAGRIEGEKNGATRGPKPSMYEAEHQGSLPRSARARRSTTATTWPAAP